MTRTEALEQARILKTLIEIAKVSKILSTFIKAFKENSFLKEDGIYYLHGNFNLTGTQSMRLSSSGPNLQNLPSNSIYGKKIKECFMAAVGWLFGGADFNALEAIADAVITKDPNKLYPMIQGIDSHCWNTFHYHPDRVPGIVETKDSINSIKKLFPTVRQDDKAITFAAQYFGTYKTFMENSGLSYDDAIRIEENYHKLYEVSDLWSEHMIRQGSKLGYVSLAFGGRLRTPILSRTVLNTRSTPYEAMNEYRSAGNALIQSYCILNNRAAIAFMDLVYKSPHRYDIHPCALIHDAIYIKWVDDIAITKWINDNLVKCMEWTDLPELQHPIVKLGAELDIFKENWANGITIPNNVDVDEILEVLI